MQLHGAYVTQKPTNKQTNKTTMTNPFFSRYTGYQSGHEHSITFPRFASVLSQVANHNTSLNVFICTLLVEVWAVPLQNHAFSKFLVPVPKHLVSDHSQMSLPLPGITVNTVSAILTLRRHLDNLSKIFSFNRVSNLLPLFL